MLSGRVEAGALSTLRRVRDAFSPRADRANDVVDLATLSVCHVIVGHLSGGHGTDMSCPEGHLLAHNLRDESGARPGCRGR